jgi:hypothetical protein
MQSAVPSANASLGSALALQPPHLFVVQRLAALSASAFWDDIVITSPKLTSIRDRATLAQRPVFQG